MTEQEEIQIVGELVALFEKNVSTLGRAGIDEKYVTNALLQAAVNVAVRTIGREKVAMALRAFADTLSVENFHRA